MKGFALLEQLVQYTGLPEQWLAQQLTQMMARKGLSVENLNIENLREFTVELLQDSILQSLHEGPTEKSGQDLL